MYDAVGARLEEEPEVNGEDASDSPIENKFSPSIVPRYIVHAQTYEFQPQNPCQRALECCVYDGM